MVALPLPNVIEAKRFIFKLNDAKLYFSAYFYPDYARKNVCGSLLANFCETHIRNSVGYITAAWAGVMLTIFGLLCCSMSVAALLMGNKG